MLQGIIAQSLVPRSDRKGRVAAVEVTLGTDAVKNHIRSNNDPADGNRLCMAAPAWNADPHREPCKLYKTGQISYETALEYSNDRTEMEKKLLYGHLKHFCIYKWRHILVARDLFICRQKHD